MNAKLSIINGQLSIILLILVLFVFPLKAQVTIGSDKNPEPFSILELEATLKAGGLRLPQLDNTERLDVQSQFAADTEAAKAAIGLVIYNTETNCLEFWNGERWVSLCNGICPATSITISPSAKEVALYETVQLDAVISPADAPNISYQWERSIDGTHWEPVTGATGATFDATATWVSDTQYRVVTTNYCGDRSISNTAFITGTGTEPLAPVNVNLYVGAFWKANQTGERLITIQRPTVDFTTNGVSMLTEDQQAIIDGAWTATVLDVNNGKNWIALDTQPSADGAVGTDNPTVSGNDPAFESGSTYQVPGTATYVDGTMNASNPKIYFRIGLKGTLAADEHRYGIVLLTYNDNSLSQRIFIRQGDTPDYLMSPTDAISSGGMDQDSRPNAVKFSAYNLTTSGSMDQAVSINGATGQSDPPATFTYYPTQVGAYFQWVNTVRVRYAWNPNIAAAPTDWDNSSIAAGSFWTGTTGDGNLSLTHESCPAGYHRPNDGITDTAFPNTTGSAVGSEMRQSLYLNPSNGITSDRFNTEWGYYADGFFDRRLFSNAVRATVSSGNNGIAYIGLLFFNPASGASLFFPSAPVRSISNGAITTSLNIYTLSGLYWSSSSTNVNNNSGWALNFSSNAVYQMGIQRPSGGSIRCVPN